MATASAANNQSIGTDEVPIFDARDNGGQCTSFYVHCLSTSTNPILINVPSLHDDGEFIAIRPGLSIIFRLGQKGLGRVNAKGSGGTAVIDWAVVAKI